MSGHQALQASVCQDVSPLALSEGGLEFVSVCAGTEHPPSLCSAKSCPSVGLGTPWEPIRVWVLGPAWPQSRGETWIKSLPSSESRLLSVNWHRSVAHAFGHLRGPCRSWASVLPHFLGLYPTPSLRRCLSPCQPPPPLASSSSSLPTTPSSSPPLPVAWVWVSGYLLQLDQKSPRTEPRLPPPQSTWGPRCGHTGRSMKME